MIFILFLFVSTECYTRSNEMHALLNKLLRHVGSGHVLQPPLTKQRKERLPSYIDFVATRVPLVQ